MKNKGGNGEWFLGNEEEFLIQSLFLHADILYIVKERLLFNDERIKRK